MSASSPALNTSPEPMRTWKMDGPPEIVDGIVMNVMTSCSLRPASRARKPPMAWMPSCELPAMRMTASEIFDTLGVPPDGCAVNVASLMKPQIKTRCLLQGEGTAEAHSAQTTIAYSGYHPVWLCQILILP